MGDVSPVADAARDDAAATAEDAATEESREAENVEYFWEDELTLASAESKLFKIIGCTTMNDLIYASYEGIHLILLDRGNRGYVTSLQNYKTLQDWWFGPRKRSEKYEGDNEIKMIECGVHVTLQVGGGTRASGVSKVESFVVTRTLNEDYNKWYMCERGNQIWKNGMDKGKFRFEARMIRNYHRNGRYEYVNPVDSEWGTESIFVSAGGSNIKEEKGRFIYVPE